MSMKDMVLYEAEQHGPCGYVDRILFGGFTKCNECYVAFRLTCKMSFALQFSTLHAMPISRRWEMKNA